MFDFLWNLHQQSRLNELESKISRGTSTPDAKVDEVREYTVVLQDRIDKLLLINMAMWSFMQEKWGLTEEQLADRVREIDLRDGTLDGRPPQGAAICQKCNRPMSRKHQRCLYCGSQTSTGSPFAGV
jgi:hypothetical protein